MDETKVKVEKKIDIRFIASLIVALLFLMVIVISSCFSEDKSPKVSTEEVIDESVDTPPLVVVNNETEVDEVQQSSDELMSDINDVEREINTVLQMMTTLAKVDEVLTTNIGSNKEEIEALKNDTLNTKEELSVFEEKLSKLRAEQIVLRNIIKDRGHIDLTDDGNVIINDPVVGKKIMVTEFFSVEDEEKNSDIGKETLTSELVASDTEVIVTNTLAVSDTEVVNTVKERGPKRWWKFWRWFEKKK